MIDQSNQILLSFGIILTAGILSGFLARKIKAPDVVVFLMAGILLGPQMTVLLHIGAESALNQIILIFGACYILFDGGASMKFKILKDIWISIVALSTIGVLVTTVIMGVAAFYILGIPFFVALLLGAAVSSTDPATLIPIFKQVKIRERVSQALIGESAFNDTMSAIITFAVLAVAVDGGDFSFRTSLISLLKQSVLGILAGAASGYLAALLIA